MGPMEDRAERQQAATDLVYVCRELLPDASEDAQRRLVERLSAYETRSLQAHRRAFVNLQDWCTRHRHKLGTDTDVEGAICEYLEQFQKATSATVQWHKLDFLKRHLSMPFVLPAKPRRKQVDGITAAEEGGVPLEPEMILRLEAHASEIDEAMDWRAGALYGAIYISRSVVRFAHMQRSVLQARSCHSLHASCFRGKSGPGGARPAFEHTAPRAPLSLTGASIMDRYWNLWKKWRQERGSALSFMIIDGSTGNALSMATFHQAVRELVVEAGAAADAQLVTSKGARMVQITIAELRNADWSERLILGNWAETPGSAGGRGANANLIPARYSGDKSNSAAFLKLMQLLLLRAMFEAHFKHHRALIDKGEAVPPLTWATARSRLQEIEIKDVTIAAAAQLESAAPREHMPGVEQPKTRSFVVEPRTHATLTEAFKQYKESKRPASEAPAAESSEAPTDTESDRDENTSDTGSALETESLHWICRRSPASAVIHLEGEAVGVPLCYSGAGTTLKQPYNRGQGVEGLRDLSRGLCQKCLTRVSSASAKALEALRGTA